MNLWFRLSQVLLRHLFAKRLTLRLTDEVMTPLRVWPNDLDTNLHMNNGRYLTLMDLGRLDFMSRVGMNLGVMVRGLLPVLGATQVIYLKPLFVGRRFCIGTKLVTWDDRWFVMQQRFVCDGVTTTKAFVRGMFRQHGKTVAPAEVLRLCGQSLPERQEPPADVAAWLGSLAKQREAAKAQALDDAQQSAR